MRPLTKPRVKNVLCLQKPYPRNRPAEKEKRSYKHNIEHVKYIERKTTKIEKGDLGKDIELQPYVRLKRIALPDHVTVNTKNFQVKKESVKEVTDNSVCSITNKYNNKTNVYCENYSEIIEGDGWDQDETRRSSLDCNNGSNIHEGGFQYICKYKQKADTEDKDKKLAIRKVFLSKIRNKSFTSIPSNKPKICRNKSSFTNRYKHKQFRKENGVQRYQQLTTTANFVKRAKTPKITTKLLQNDQRSSKIELSDPINYRNVPSSSNYSKKITGNKTLSTTKRKTITGEIRNSDHNFSGNPDENSPSKKLKLDSIAKKISSTNNHVVKNNDSSTGVFEEKQSVKHLNNKDTEQVNNSKAFAHEFCQKPSLKVSIDVSALDRDLLNSIIDRSNKKPENYYSYINEKCIKNRLALQRRLALHRRLALQRRFKSNPYSLSGCLHSLTRVVRNFERRMYNFIFTRRLSPIRYKTPPNMVKLLDVSGTSNKTTNQDTAGNSSTFLVQNKISSDIPAEEETNSSTLFSDGKVFKNTTESVDGLEFEKIDVICNKYDKNLISNDNNFKAPCMANDSKLVQAIDNLDDEDRLQSCKDDTKTMSATIFVKGTQDQCFKESDFEVADVKTGDIEKEELDKSSSSPSLQKSSTNKTNTVCNFLEAPSKNNDHVVIVEQYYSKHKYLDPPIHSKNSKKNMPTTKNINLFELDSPDLSKNRIEHENEVIKENTNNIFTNKVCHGSFMKRREENIHHDNFENDLLDLYTRHDHQIGRQNYPKIINQENAASTTHGSNTTEAAFNYQTKKLELQQTAITSLNMCESMEYSDKNTSNKNKQNEIGSKYLQSNECNETLLVVDLEVVRNSHMDGGNSMDDDDDGEVTVLYDSGQRSDDVTTLDTRIFEHLLLTRNEIQAKIEIDEIKSNFNKIYSSVFTARIKYLCFKMGVLLSNEIEKELEVEPLTSTSKNNMDSKRKNESYRKRNFSECFCEFLTSMYKEKVDENLRQLLLVAWFNKVYDNIPQTSQLKYSLSLAKENLTALLPEFSFNIYAVAAVFVTPIKTTRELQQERNLIKKMRRAYKNGTSVLLKQTKITNVIQQKPHKVSLFNF